MVRDWYFVGTIDNRRNGKPCLNVYSDLINYYVIDIKDYVSMDTMNTFESEIDLERYFRAYKINIKHIKKNKEKIKYEKN